MNTENDSVPVRSESPDRPPATPADDRWWWPSTRRGKRLAGSLVFVVFVLGAAVFAAFTVQLPYYEFHPGSARPVAPLIQVEGAETYPPESSIAYLTVSLSRSTLASMLWSNLDDDVRVVDETVVLGDRSPEENRTINLALMDTSKQDATRDALVALGYDVPVTIGGHVVVDVAEGSGADGILSVGDVLTAVDGQALDQPDRIREVLGALAPGAVVEVTRTPIDPTAPTTVSVTLGPADDDPNRGVMGVLLQVHQPQYHFPFDVQIDTAQVGGPSGGLAFTLALLDVLTPGELTGGLDVAVTGTIDAGGNVGPVGGVPQKTAVVVEHGYDVFLVPAEEYDQAKERAGDRVRVYEVGTLADALDVLESLGGSGLGADTGR